MQTRVATTVGCAVLAAAGLAGAVARAQGYEPLAFDPAGGYTMFSVPRMAKPPVPDGVIAPGEWDQAFAINAMADQHTRPPWGFLYARWARWRLAWDADNVYLCCESQRLPNENLVVEFRDPTLGGNTVFDDSVEVHFTPVGRNGVGGKLPWSAQSILNPVGVGFYSKFVWSVAARTSAWRPDWKIGNKIEKDRWVMELTVPCASLDLGQPNQAGEPWSFLLARNWKRTGWHQSALPGRYTSFGVPREQSFGYLTDKAFVQLDDLAGLFKGDIRIALNAGTAGAASEPVSVKAAVYELASPLKPGDTGTAVWVKADAVTAEPGKLTPWAVKEAGKLAAGKTYRLELEAKAASSPHPLLHLNVLVAPGSDARLAEAAAKLKAEAYGFSARLAPTRSLLDTFADFMNAPDPDAPKAAAIELRKKGAQEAVFAGASSNVHYFSIRDRFQLPALAPGAYEWSMALKDGAGKTLATGTGQIEKQDEPKEFPWFNFSGGDVEKVLWPYSRLAVHNGGARIDYWGGSLYLSGGCVPRQVAVTANREWRPALLEERPSVLSREVEATAVHSGKTAAVVFQGFPRTTAVADHRARLRGYGRIGETVEVQADAEVTQDGLIWVTWTLRPSVDTASGKDVRRPQATLDSLTIDIPFPEPVARLMLAMSGTGDEIGAVPAGEGVVWDCTTLGFSPLTVGNLAPMIWLGNDQRGLCVLAENNRGWAHKGLPDQQILRRGGEVVLRLNVIQEPVTLTGDRAFAFGFLPSPMRKMTPGWRLLNCSFSQSFADGFYTGRIASRDEYHNASYMPASYQKSRDLMIRSTRDMITRAFEFAPHTEQGSGYQTRSADWKARGYFGPEWDENTYTREYQDHLLWYMQRWMDEGGLTGVYHDQFAPSTVANTTSGTAWILPDGRTNPGYNLLLDRRFTAREYALMLENGIQPRIFCHTTNGGELYAYPWVTAILDGEDNMVIANADYDFADIYPPARMQAYGNPWPWGNTFYWMRLIQPGEEAWRKRQDRTYLGWTYLHDVFNNNAGEQQFWQRFLDWGMNDGAVKYWPYWRTEKVLRASDPAVLVSLWTLPDRALLCLFNSGKNAMTDVTVRVPTVDLGLMPDLRSEYTKAYDLETDAAVPFDGWNGAVTCALPAHDFKLVAIRLYRD
jgi:hypothetical protein